MKRLISRGIFVVIAGISLVCCNNKDTFPFQSEYIPQAPDYTDSAMWIISTNDLSGHGADVFYVPSTWEFDWVTADSQICHYADITNEKHLAHMSIEMAKVAEYMYNEAMKYDDKSRGK